LRTSPVLDTNNAFTEEVPISNPIIFICVC
jgi:hypothetical protein